MGLMGTGQGSLMALGFVWAAEELSFCFPVLHLQTASD